MKLKITYLVFLIVGTINLFSQIEIRRLPYYLDYRWHNKPADYVRTAHLKPYPMPAYAYKIKPGPPKIQTESGIELINISQASSHQSECFIKINPKDPNNIVIGSNDYRYNSSVAGFKMSAFYSFDGGNTWRHSTTPSNLDLGVISYPTQDGGATNVDPGIAFDTEGNPYYIYLFAQLFDNGSFGDNGVFVAKSTDGGKTWLSDNVGAAVLIYQDALQDKCFIATDSDPNSPYANRTYASWFDTKYPFGIGFSYSFDGLNFSSPVTIPGSSGKSVQSPLPVVGPNGVLYVTWEEKEDGGAKTKAMVQKSTDGGQSWVWPYPKVAQTVYTCGEIVGYRRALPDKGDMRISSHPYMDIDLRTGNLYLVQSGRDINNKYGVFLSISTDGGETWSAGSKIENLYKVDGNTVGNDVFLSSIAVDPITGLIAVLYYSSENDPENNTGCDAFVAVSFDEGKTFNHIQLTDTWYFRYNSVFDAGGDNLGRYWGDYTSIDAYDGKIYPCFWMPTSSNADFWSCDLFTAKLSTSPKPPSNLSLNVDIENPNKVIINWIDPTENQLGAPLNEFKVLIFKGNEKIGEVDKGVQTFTDNNGIPGETVTYNLKVRTSQGHESEFVSISGIVGGSLEPKAPENIMAIPKQNGIQIIWTNPVEHTDGTYLYDLHSIEIYVDDELQQTVSGTEIQAGEQSSYFVELPTEKFYKIKLKAKTKRGDFTKNSVYSQEIIAYSGAPLLEFEENFDDEQNLIPTYKTGTWGLTTEAAYSTPNSLTDSPNDRYSNNDHYMIYFAPFVVTEGKTTLQFQHIGLIAKQDIGIVSISNNFGQKYDGIAWVDIDRSNKWDNGTFDVTKSQWFEQGIDLSDYIGDTVFIRFEMLTSPLSNKDGWYIDDLKLGDYPVGINEHNDLSTLIDLNLYPNPTSNELIINYRIPKAGNLNIQLFDNLGRKITTLMDSYQDFGQYTTEFNLSNLNSGLYFIKINLNGKSCYKSIIISK